MVFINETADLTQALSAFIGVCIFFYYILFEIFKHEVVRTVRTVR